MDRDHIERILLNEEDALDNSVQALTSYENILPTASSPHVAFSVQNNSGPYAATPLSGQATIPASESCCQNQLGHARLLFQTGHNQPGSNPPLFPPFSALPSLMMAPALRPIPQPLGHGLGVALPGTNTTITSSGPTSARPMSSAQPFQTPSAAPTQGTIALDQVSQIMGDVLQHFRIEQKY